MVTKGFVLHRNDNVATLVNGASEGETVVLQGFADGSIVAKSPIPNGHKIALRALPAGADVIKYGFVVGRLVKTARAGEHMHIQNMQSLRGRGDLRTKA
jgi:altronate dehydratase small subunit